MTCASCVANNEKPVGDLPGVEKVAINLATGGAQIEYTPDITSISEIRKAIQKLSYEVTDRVGSEVEVDKDKYLVAPDLP